MPNPPVSPFTKKPAKANTKDNKLRTLCPCLLLFFITAPLLPAEEPLIPGITEEDESAPFLSLHEALTEALSHNLDLEAERQLEKRTLEGLSIAQAPFDPRLELRTSTSTRQQSRAASELDGAPRPREETFQTRAILRQRATPGTEFSLSTVLNRRETNSDRATLNPASDADVSLDIRQPLLRHRGREVNRAEIEKSLLEQERAGKQFKSRAMDLILETELAYYALAVAHEERQLRELSLRIAQQLLADSQLRREAGAGTRLDILRAEVRVADNQESLLQAEQTLQNRKDTLLDLLGPVPNEEDFRRNFRVAPIEAPKVTSFEVQSVLARALEQDPDRQSLIHRISQLDIDETVARNRRLPNLDLGGNLSFTGREEGFDRAFRELSDGEGYFWQVDLTLQVPWGMREERSRYRQARLQLHRERILLQRLEQSLRVGARDAVRAVRTARERLEVSRLGTSLSEEQLNLETERYQAGAGTSREVLDAQEDFESARLRELRALRDLREAVSRLRRFEGDNLSWHGLVLEERY